MSKFSRIPVLLSEEQLSIDSGISVRDALVLISDSKYKEDLLHLFNVNDFITDFIKIPGATTLVQAIMAKDKEFFKTDINSILKNVSINGFNEDNSLNIKIKEETNQKTNTTIAKTIYSAKSDFLDDMFKLGKFADYCIKNDCSEIIDNNIEFLKSKFGNDKAYSKRYRILTDEEDNKYLRAITSTERYHDYNLKLSIFIALITLHLNSKDSKETFRVKKFIYNESYLNVYFENEEVKNIEKLGYVKFVIELSNDEVKKEALKFSAICNLYVEHENKEGSFFIKPNNVKSGFLSIKHSSKPKTVVNELKLLQEKSRLAKITMYEDILSVNKITKPDQIRHLIRTKIDNSTTEELQKYKKRIVSELFEEVRNIHELLLLMDKIYLIVNDSDIEAKEYLMYLLYDAITCKAKDDNE